MRLNTILRSSSRKSSHKGRSPQGQGSLTSMQKYKKGHEPECLTHQKTAPPVHMAIETL